MVAPPESGARESLGALLGGRRVALDASLPGAAFALGWLVAARTAWTPSPVAVGSAAAVAVALGVSIVRVRRKAPPRAALFGLLGVCAAAGVALYTGRPEDFFLLQLLSNTASAIVWALSVLVRWPLLGVVVGVALGQRSRWRRDPELLRAYSRASWVWVGQYVVRVTVYAPLWVAGEAVALGVARLVLSWPLVAACLAMSWWALRRSLPGTHPGLRHPVAAQ